jgi:hypothetical protein
MGLIACQGGKREGESGGLPSLPNALSLPGPVGQLPVTHFWLNCPRTGTRGPFFLLTQKVRSHVAQSGAVRKLSYHRDIGTKLQALRKNKPSMAASLQTVFLLAVASLGGQGWEQ